MKIKGDINNYFKLEYGMSYNEFKCIKDEKINEVNSNKKQRLKKIKSIYLQDQKSQLNIYFKDETGMTYEEFSKIKLYTEPKVLKKIKK